MRRRCFFVAGVCCAHPLGKAGGVVAHASPQPFLLVALCCAGGSRLERKMACFSLASLVIAIRRFRGVQDAELVSARLFVFSRLASVLPLRLLLSLFGDSGMSLWSAIATHCQIAGLCWRQPRHASPNFGDGERLDPEAAVRQVSAAPKTAPKETHCVQ